MKEALPEILNQYYGLKDAAPRFLRESGGRAYLVEGHLGQEYRAEGKNIFFLKVFGKAFADTSRQSISVTRYLEENGFPVPKTFLTLSGDAMPEVLIDGEERLIVLQEYIEGDEPDLEKRAEEVGELTYRLHSLLERFPEEPVTRGKQFFIERYTGFLRRKDYPRTREYEELGESLWHKVEDLPYGNCHGDLHRGNLLETADGQIYFLDFDTVCRAPVMFDVSVMCDMTDYFDLKQEDIDVARSVYERFLSGYSKHRTLSVKEIRSFYNWIAIRHFQLQATILEMFGIDCVDGRFIDSQLGWLERWLRETEQMT